MNKCLYIPLVPEHGCRLVVTDEGKFAEMETSILELKAEVSSCRSELSSLQDAIERRQEVKHQQVMLKSAAGDAVEYLKQIITLSSGILALSATFLASGALTSWHEITFLLLAWASLGISVFFSLETISAIIQSGINSDHQWHKNPGKRSATIAKHSFIAGLFLFATSAIDGATSDSTKPEQSSIEIDFSN